jgi:uncharacterized protein YjbI with pentapeptide repeats
LLEPQMTHPPLDIVALFSDEIHPPGEVADHRYGAYGALQLVPDQRPYDAEGNLMDARAHLISVIAANARACDLDLRNAALAGAELSRLSADRIDLGTADLSGAKLTAARLGSCRLDAAIFEDADCSGATLRQCTLDGVRGAGARFDNARIEDSSAKGADLARASLCGTRLTETSFARAVLREAMLEGAEGDGVEFRGADLAQASLRGARLDEADFRGADLTGADLTGGRFHDADFRGALLDGTRFDQADCAGARFDEGAGPAAAPDRNAKDAAAAAFDAAALRDTIAALQGALGRDGGGNAIAEMLARVQQAIAELDATADEPPEAWKPWLEPLMRMANGEQPFDLKVVLDALATFGKAQPKRNEPGNGAGG